MFSEFVEEQTLLFVALVIIIAMLVYSYLGERLSGFKSVNTDEATRLFNDGAFMLDVRASNEYKEGLIGDAKNISASDLSSKMNLLPKDKEKPIVVYCLSGMRSSNVASKLVKAGYTQVVNLSGGINAWKAAGLPVVKAKSKKAKKKAAAK
ncbi:MAG: rhodanese-like domain-containing protein [Thiomicrorhabdus sp.]|nr:rhodanese-like domain-containing protein [Thiomicrorhabdus sp.]